MKGIIGLYRDKNAFLFTRQKMIGSIFPENIEFDGRQYRTNRANEVFAEICCLDKGFNIKRSAKMPTSPLRLPLLGKKELIIKYLG